MRKTNKHVSCWDKDKRDSGNCFRNYNGNYTESVEIIKEIVAHFGGGWVDDNDCDDDPYYPYYPVVTNVNGNIKPVRYVTMEEIRKVFGNNVL